MNIKIREYNEADIPQMMDIWNKIVEDGVAFPQMENLTRSDAINLFSAKSFAGVAEDITKNEILGLYTMHPNNVGRCGHTANACYAVKLEHRGLNIGEELVKHSIKKGKELGFKLMQFNAVVKTNYSAIHLYKKLGFKEIGVVPGGFLLKNGEFEDIVLFYQVL